MKTMRSGRGPCSRVAMVMVLAAPALLGIPRSAGAGTLSPELQAILAQTPPTTRVPVLMMLTAQANLDEVAGTIESRDDRLPLLVEALKTQAIATQNDPGPCGEPGLIAELVAAGPQHAANIRRLWVTNAVAVEATPAVITGCAARADVSEVGFAGARDVMVPADTPPVPQWNITHVGAPDAWALGYRGAGGIVAAIDSGANAAHPDLAANLLCNTPTNPCHPTTNPPIWHDAVGGQTTPYDDDGHGTHLLGVAVGKNGIGVAPDAKWMACKAFTPGAEGLTTTAARILECAQWILAPDAPALEDPTPPDPAHVPDAVLVDLVISAAGHCDPFLQNVVRVWRAARILPVFSVGDDPLGVPVGAVPSPANDPKVFSVGAADATDQILPTTHRGLAFCPGPTTMAPRLVAPGVDVVSAWTGTARRVLEGSEVAAAHVAGAVALVRGGHPDTRRVSVDLLDQALVSTGVPAADGQKRLDVLAAVTLQEAEFVQQVPLPTICLDTGQHWPTTVTFRNAGLTTWRQGIHKLRYVGPPSLWGFGDVVELPVAEVLPGEQIQFTLPLIAPNVPNLSPGYRFEWQMYEVGEEYFGPKSPVGHVCVRGVDKAGFVDQDVSALCGAPGVTVGARVTFRNTGTTTWKGSQGYELRKLGTYSDPPVWPLTTDVPPGGTKDFLLSFYAPSPTGTYTFQRRMWHGTWFGDASPKVVVDTYTCSTDDSIFLNANNIDLGELRVGQSLPLSLPFKNTGQTTWRSTYCLKGSAFGAATAPVCLPSAVTKVPGQSHTFDLTLVTPNAPGRHEVRLQVHNAQGEAFGETFVGTVGIPRDHQASLEFTSTQGANNWFYRYYDPGIAGWRKLSWNANGGYWHRSGGSQKVWQQSVLPGNSNSVARFWKSHMTGPVRVSGSAADQDGTCGDGFKLRVRKNQTILREWNVDNGGSQTYAETAYVNPGDTIRVIVGPRGNNNCDLTLLDPLLQVLPPAHPTLGSAPSENATVGNQETEPGGD